jgi:cytochrome oxidase assembly protein ShyY1
MGLLQSGIAMILIVLCLLAGQWQLHKGEARSQQNGIIKHNQTLAALTGDKTGSIDPIKDQWRQIALLGNFDSAHLLLLRNRYFEGKYGFEVLILFRAVIGGNYWVDRGWVVAGPAANIAPEIPPITTKQISILVRLRSDDISRQIEGSLFALPGTRRSTIDLTSAQGVTANAYYVDLISSKTMSVAPLTPIALPELTSGPHFAYALQWLAFATLILVGRILLFRETQ